MGADKEAGEGMTIYSCQNVTEEQELTFRVD